MTVLSVFLMKNKGLGPLGVNETLQRKKINGMGT